MSRVTLLKSRVQTLKRINGSSTIQTEDRLTGQAGVDRRSRWLSVHPLCAECDDIGLITAGEIVDHVIPLWKGGADNEVNFQTLCRDHHDMKTTREQRERFGYGDHE